MRRVRGTFRVTLFRAWCPVQVIGRRRVEQALDSDLQSHALLRCVSKPAAGEVWLAPIASRVLTLVVRYA